MTRRTERVAALIRSVLGEILQKKLKDPGLGFVTVSAVDVAPDLKTAKVYYTILNKAKPQLQATQKALERAAGFMQHGIAEELKLRFTPKLAFHLDESYEEGMRIESILEGLQSKNDNNKSHER